MLNQSLMFLANQASGFFNERYLNKEYTKIKNDFFHVDRYLKNKETNRQSFGVQCDNSQVM